jgi:hypothetical protein
MPDNRPPTSYLIVNADDYGRFACTSHGIIDAAARGMVTATGILANVDALEERLHWLDSVPDLERGIHLTLTSGRPLTRPMRERWMRYGGMFPNKYEMLRSVCCGAVALEDVLVEWTAQIERLLALGVRLHFINSHEHLHMFPPLYRVSATLADRFGIDHLRHARPSLSLRAIRRFSVRDLALAVLGAYCSSYRRGPSIPFLGLEDSGRLDAHGLEKIIKGLKPGVVSELMCHPGYYDPTEIDDPRLRQYHAWERELEALTGGSVLKLCKRLSIQLVRFKDLRSLRENAPLSRGEGRIGLGDRSR